MDDTAITPIDVFDLMRHLRGLKGTRDIRGSIMDRMNTASMRLETAVGFAQQAVPMLDDYATIIMLQNEADQALVYLTEVRDGLFERGRDIEGVELAMLVISHLLGREFTSKYDEFEENL